MSTDDAALFPELGNDNLRTLTKLSRKLDTVKTHIDVATRNGDTSRASPKMVAFLTELDAHLDETWPAD